MTCKTCRREDMADACGPRENRPCPCCGMRLIAETEPTEESQETDQEVQNTENR